MKIDTDGFLSHPSNMEVKTEVKGKETESSSLVNSVLWGHSRDGIIRQDATRNSILNNSDGTIEALKDKAAALKGNLAAIFNKMDTGTVVKMNEDDVDINNTEADRLVTVVERIQIKLAMYCDDFQATADVDVEDVIKTMGAGAAAYRIAQSFEQNAVKPTKENVSQVLGALDKADKIGEIGDSEKAFILQNNMKPTINNVYVAANAGYVNRTGTISDRQWSELKPQVEKIIENSGIDVNENSIRKGRWMIENDIDVTAENFEKLDALDKINDVLNSEELPDRITAAMTEGLRAGDTLLTGEEYSWEKAARTEKIVKSATAVQVMAWVHSDRPYTLAGLRETQDAGDKMTPDNSDYNYVKATRELYQIRLMMTTEAVCIMEKSGIPVDTTELSELVEELKRTETAILGEMPKFNEVTMKDTNRVNEVLEVFDRLRNAPSAVIGNVVKENRQPSAIAMISSSALVTAKMAAAGEAYEALSTEIRSDLGDSVSKAIKASTGDILSGFGYEDNEENRRAVRILAYNSMEINEKNVDSVKSIDYSVNKLFRSMTPQAVLQMIRDGINPLEADVTELDSYLTQAGQNEASDAEKYSEFLYRLDKKGNITGEEREKYIGIYRLIAQFKKDGLNSAGALIKQGLPLTMGNLLTAYMTRKDSKIELSADDDTELVKVRDKITYYKNLFGEIQKKVTPDAIKNLPGEFDEMTPEQFADSIRSVDIYNSDAVYARYTENAWQAANMPEEVYRFVTENGIPATYNNLAAVQTILRKPASLFDRYRTEKKDSDKDEEESILDMLDDREAVRTQYDEMVKNTGEIVHKALNEENSSLRMDALKSLACGVSLLAGLAHRNNYFIPYKNDGDTGVINLKIIEEADNKGSFSVRMYDENFGRITVEAKVDNESVTAYIMCDSADGMKTAGQASDDIKTQLAAHHFSKVYLSVNEVKAQPDYGAAAKNEVPTGKIFEAAKIFVVNLAKQSRKNADISDRYEI